MSAPKGGRKSADARRSMEAFALMREQLKREREIKADLLAVTLRAKAWIEGVMADEFGWPAERVQNPPDGSHLHAINAAIAKATGENT